MAWRLADQCQSLLRPLADSHVVQRVLNGKKEDTNQTYLSYFYHGFATMEETVYLSCVEFFLRDFVFSELRQKRNYGYVAGADLMSLHKQLGVVVVLNGESFDMRVVEAEIDQILKEFLD
jgi:secreted Zn-dependent insulinase-like peptidase